MTVYVDELRTYTQVSQQARRYGALPVTSRELAAIMIKKIEEAQYGNATP